jgi:tRNA dimethylallyltransferase
MLSPWDPLVSDIQKKLQGKKGVIVIGGPTASGKSAFALDLAAALSQFYPVEIINADSQQLYEGLPLLTAKPSAEDMGLYPHHLYSAYPNQPPSINAMGWHEQACKHIDQAHAHQRCPLIVGGTGFYLRVLEKGLSLMPQVPWTDLSHLSLVSLREQLTKADPILCQKLHPHDRQRMERALRIYENTGKPLSFWQEKQAFSSPYVFFNILKWVDKETLTAKMKRRFLQLCDLGLLEEVETFTLEPGTPLAKSIGFQHLKDFVNGVTSWEKAQELFFISTLQYAKRQKTWFQSQFEADVRLP